MATQLSQTINSLPKLQKFWPKRQIFWFDDGQPSFLWKYLTFNWSLASSRQLEHWQWKKYLFFNISLLCSVVFNKSLSKYVHLILEKSSTFKIDLIISSLPSKGLLNQVLLGALKWSKKFLNTFLERDLPSIK